MLEARAPVRRGALATIALATISPAALTATGEAASISAWTRASAALVLGIPRTERLIRLPPSMDSGAIASRPQLGRSRAGSPPSPLARHPGQELRCVHRPCRLVSPLRCRPYARAGTLR